MGKVRACSKDPVHILKLHVKIDPIKQDKQEARAPPASMKQNQSPIPSERGPFC